MVIRLGASCPQRKLVLSADSYPIRDSHVRQAWEPNIPTSIQQCKLCNVSVFQGPPGARLLLELNPGSCLPLPASVLNPFCAPSLLDSPRNPFLMNSLCPWPQLSGLLGEPGLQKRAFYFSVAFSHLFIALFYTYKFLPIPIHVPSTCLVPPELEGDIRSLALELQMVVNLQVGVGNQT